MMKKILVLGIGPAQVDLITAAKEMGMEVFALAYDASGPGYALVDGFRQADIKNTEAITSYALEKEVDMVYSMALESAVPPIATVSEELGLPTFVSMETLNKLNNKAQWRKELGDMEGNVKWQNGTQLEAFENWAIYPAILKPVDASGQRGVHKVDSYEDVVAIFEESLSHSKIKELIIEKYVEGPEISVNSMMQDGELKFAVISDRISYDDYPGGIIKEHHVPSRIVTERMEKKIYTLVEKVNQIMGLRDGHIYFQLKLQDLEPQIIEFTPRFDGCHMWRLIFESTGLDLRKVALELLAHGKSETMERFKPPSDYKACKIKFLSDVPETVVQKDRYPVPSNPLYVEWYYEEGQRVKRVTGYLEKVGYIIVEE